MVVHVPSPPLPLVSGSQLPLTHTKFVPGFGVVQVLGTIQGGSQLPFTQLQLAAGLGVVQVLVGVGATQTPFTQV